MTLTLPASGLMAGLRFTVDTINDSWMPWLTAPAGGQAWGTANRAIYIPVRFPTSGVVKELGYVAEGSAATGNIDIGLYDASGTRLCSTGSQTKALSDTVAVFDVTDTTVQRGLYYLALNNSTTTDTFYADIPAAPNLAARGVLTEAVGAVTLPATATWALNQTLALFPVIVALMVTEVS